MSREEKLKNMFKVKDSKEYVDEYMRQLGRIKKMSIFMKRDAKLRDMYENYSTVAEKKAWEKECWEITKWSNDLARKNTVKFFDDRRANA